MKELKLTMDSTQVLPNTKAAGNDMSHISLFNLSDSTNNLLLQGMITLMTVHDVYRVCILEGRVSRDFRSFYHSESYRPLGDFYEVHLFGERPQKTDY